MWPYKARLQQHLAAELGAFSDSVHLVDGIPILLYGFSRTQVAAVSKGVAAYGYCAAKKQTYYGFHGHLLISATGVIPGFSITSANGNEREALWDMVPSTQGLLIGDKGYLSITLQHDLQRVSVGLETALRSNMQDARDPAWVTLLKRLRRLIETVIGQLVERFSLKKVWARDQWHLTSRINRKLLTHTVCRWLNRHASNPLQFEQLVAPWF